MRKNYFTLIQVKLPEIILKWSAIYQVYSINNKTGGKMIKELTNENFEDAVKTGVTVVDFWAPWCGPCKMIHPIVEELSNDMDDVEFAKLNIDEAQQVAMKYQVMSIPTLIVFKNGSPQETIIGVTPKEKIKKKIQNVV